MKTSVIFLLLVAAATCLAQPTPEWTSPSITSDSEGMGWVVLRTNPQEIRFYREDSAHIHIMSGVYSTTIAVTIAKPGDFYQLRSLGYDVTGDGIYDLEISQWHGYGTPTFRFGIRIVNPMNGQTFYEFDNPDYSYALWRGNQLGMSFDYYDYIADIDNDGWNELVIIKFQVGTYGYEDYQYFVYQTNGSATGPTGGSQLPSNFSLNQNYPNPFNPATNITYELIQSEPIEIQIFDPAGRLVRSYTPGVQTPGPHKWVWDGKNNIGSSAASGVYFYTLSAGARTEAKKMIMLK